MNFRSINDLDLTLKRSLHRIPREIDLIAGIPRSGMLVASILSLHRNVHLVDLNELLRGEIGTVGSCRSGIGRQIRTIEECRRILVVDDSVLSGSEMREARQSIAATSFAHKVMYAAVYVTAENKDLVDIPIEICEPPRVFEWNLMHGFTLPKCCVDIDGLLCDDPTEEENDDGKRYLSFLENARPFHLPTAEIGMLVTSRLEKYRPQTESWLEKHGIRYRDLVMMQYATMAERQAAAAYASFKANAFKDSEMLLFLESSEPTAVGIAKLSGKPAVCTETMRIYQPGGIPLLKQKIKETGRRNTDLLSRAANRLLRVVRSRSLN